MDTELKYNIIIITFLFFFILTISTLFLAIVYFLLKFLKNKLKLNSKFLSKKYLIPFISIFLIIFSLYQSITAVYPNDSFYFDEFKYVTKREIPKSAKIKFKESSYPDFHGDYSSKSIIELSERDFNQLLKELENDKSLNEAEHFKENVLKVFERKIKGESDRFLFIYFLKDRKTIIVRVDFT